MGNDRTAVKLYITAIFGCALIAAALSWGHVPTALEIAQVVVLGVCAGVAHWFPIRSSADGVSFRLTNVFIITGAVVLDPALLLPLACLAVASDVWLRRHRGWGRVLIGFFFNCGQTALAAHVANAWVGWFGHLPLGPLAPMRDLGVLAGGALAFSVVQELTVAVIIALAQRIPLLRVSTFSLPALLSTALVGVLGVVVSGLWLAKPILLILLPPIFFITYRLTRNAHLAHLAQVDAKTGLHNYRHFESVLEEEMAHSLRARRPLSLIFTDLDHFKKVNDQYGHAAGDAVLRELSGLLSGMVRKGDVVARFGGEEFVVLLPGTDVDEAAYLGERIRATVEGHPFPIPGGTSIRCTVSVGVAGYPDHASTFSTLLEQADAAMYLAKRTRNAVARPDPTAAPMAQGHAPKELAQPAVAVTAHVPAPAAPVAQRVPAPPTVRAPRPPAASPIAGSALWTVVAAGFVALGGSIVATQVSGAWLALAPFMALAVVAELLKVQVYEADRRNNITLSFAHAVTFSTLMTAPQGAPVVNVIAALVHIVVTRQRAPEKALFNIANVALSAVVTSWVFTALHPSGVSFTIGHALAAVPATAAYYAVNDGLIALMISLHTGRSWLGLMRESAWYVHIKGFLALTGAFLGGAYQELGPLAVTMFAVPLLILRFTLTLYAQRTQRYIESLQAAKAEVEVVNNEKEEMLRKLIETVALIIDARDNSVSGHSRRVAKFAMAIGKELGMSTADLATLHTAGLFHDLGKVGIPEAILHKPAKLTADEYTVIKEHAALGQRILSEVPQLAEIARMVGEHHERYDGFGYPLGLAAEQISLGGRILVVADALETMLADRPYSRGRELHLALAELDRCVGSHFDPAVVAAVHRAVSLQGGDFFASAERLAERDWGAADQILAQVFA